MMEQLTPEHFLPHVDKSFRVDGGRHALVLTRVDLGPAVAATGNLRQPFTLIFRGPPGDVLHEGLYGFQVAEGPAFTFYVIPIHTPARDRQDYQAVFN